MQEYAYDVENGFDSIWSEAKTRYQWVGCACCGGFRKGWIKAKDYRFGSKPNNSKKKTLRSHRAR